MTTSSGSFFVSNLKVISCWANQSTSQLTCQGPDQDLDHMFDLKNVWMNKWLDVCPGHYYKSPPPTGNTLGLPASIIGNLCGGGITMTTGLRTCCRRRGQARPGCPATPSHRRHCEVTSSSCWRNDHRLKKQKNKNVLIHQKINASENSLKMLCKIVKKVNLVCSYSKVAVWSWLTIVVWGWSVLGQDTESQVACIMHAV